jgi:hypothetical protein
VAAKRNGPSSASISAGHIGIPVDMEAMYAGADSSSASVVSAGMEATTAGSREGAV